MTSKYRPWSLLSSIGWRKRSFAERGAIAINIPLLCLLLSLAAHVYLRYHTLETELRADRIQHTLQESRTLLVDLLNAETGVRGYYNSRLSEFLEPYHLGLKKFPQTLTRIERLVIDNPSQIKRLKQIEQMSAQKLTILHQAVARVQTEEAGTISTVDVKASMLLGERVMERLRNVLANFEAEENRHLDSNYQQLQNLRDLDTVVIVLSVIISSIGAAIATGLFKSLATELQERESSLQGSQNLIAAVFGNVVDSVLTLDAKGKITACNDAVTTMFGYNRQQLLGSDWQMLLGTQDNEIPPLANSAQDLASGGRLWQTRGQHQNGNGFPIEISLGRIEAEQRQIAIVRDLTLRQQSEAKLQARAQELAHLNLTLRRINNQLQERNRELDRFAYVTSHDLKAPLRAIANLSSWIAEDLGDNLPPENQQQILLLRGRVDRMESLIEGLLEYSRIGRRQVPVEYTEVGALVTEIITRLAPPQTFTIDIAADLPKFETRRVLLKQVLMGLIANAIQHHPRTDGKMQITATDIGDAYEFAVTDDGQGIEPQYHERIYNIFQTLQARDRHESTGVGLAIVKKIVESEGGSIGIKSSLGCGATFSFSWLKHPLEYIAELPAE